VHLTAGCNPVHAVTGVPALGVQDPGGPVTSDRRPEAVELSAWARACTYAAARTPKS
jgi:hypothetical protein